MGFIKETAEKEIIQQSLMINTNFLTFYGGGDK